MVFLEDRWRDGVETSLEPGESVLLLAPISTAVSGSSTDFYRMSRDLPDPRKQWIIRGFTFPEIIDVNTQRFELWSSGSAGWGTSGSWAVLAWWVTNPVAARLVLGSKPPRLAGVQEKLLPDDTVIALTDRRLLFFANEGDNLDPEAVFVLGIPRAEISGALRRATGLRILSRGRVEVSFVDGSMIELRLGIVRSGRARRFVELLQLGRTVLS